MICKIMIFLRDLQIYAKKSVFETQIRQKSIDEF